VVLVLLVVLLRPVHRYLLGVLVIHFHLFHHRHRCHQVILVVQVVQVVQEGQRFLALFWACYRLEHSHQYNICPYHHNRYPRNIRSQFHLLEDIRCCQESRDTHLLFLPPIVLRRNPGSPGSPKQPRSSSCRPYTWLMSKLATKPLNTPS
jgi:hypothetical protein